MNYFLGVDAGGTKTKAVVIDENSRILGEANGGPANYHNVGLAQATTAVFSTISVLLDKLKLSLDGMAWCTIGIASCDTKKDYERLFGAFSTNRGAPLVNKITVVNDSKIGIYTGILPPGIVVVCGTGCNVYGINAHGEEAWAGNWGPVLGDRGSGYALGQRLLKTVIAYYDGTSEPTKLVEKTERRLKIHSAADIMDWYNDHQPSVHQVSDLAPVVIETAEEGDEIAKQLVSETIDELGKALISVVTRLKVDEEYNRVVIVGGLFESKHFRALFEGHVTALLKHVRVVKPLVPAAVGAAILAKEKWRVSLQLTANSSQQNK